jgi:hypothetical protein
LGKLFELFTGLSSFLLCGFVLKMVSLETMYCHNYIFMKQKVDSKELQSILEEEIKL